jgi:hypothetical protein
MGKLEGGYSKLAAEAEKTGYGRAPLPKGEYDAIVTSASYRKSKAGNDTYNVSFAITDGKLKGRTFFHNLTLAGESNASIFFQQMAGYGLDAAFWADVEDDDDAHEVVCAELLDAEFHVTAGEPKEYQGDLQTRITSIKSLDGSSSAGARIGDEDEDEPTRPTRRRRAAADEDEAAPVRRSRRTAAPDPAPADEEEEYEDEDEEPTPPPAAKRARRGKPTLPPGVAGSKDI